MSTSNLAIVAFLGVSFFLAAATLGQSNGDQGGAAANAQPASAQHGAPVKLPAGVIGALQRVTFSDAQLQCDAGTIYIPVGWKFEGGMVWSGDLDDPVSLGARISDPNGLEQETVYPHGQYIDGFRDFMMACYPARAQRIAMVYAEGTRPGIQYGLNLGSENRRRPTDAVAYLKQFVFPQYRQDLAAAKVASSDDQPELQAKLLEGLQNQMSAAAAKSAGAQGINVSTAQEALGFQLSVTKVRMEYAIGSTPVQEDFYCVLGSHLVQGLQHPRMGFQSLPEVRSWFARVLSYRAESGKLERRASLFRVINQSVRDNPHWYNLALQVAQMRDKAYTDAARAQTEMQRQHVASQVRIATMREQASEQMSDERMQMYQDREAAQDDSARKWDEAIQDVEGYKDPSGNGVIEAPLAWNHVYMRSSDNTIIGSDNYLPSEEVGAEGLQLLDKAQ